MKEALRRIISFIPGLRFWVAKWIFFRNASVFRFWGVYPTADEARKHIPARFNIGFDEPNIREDFDETIRERDLHLVGVLAGLIPHARTLFDLGGNIGLCFYQYRTRIAYPPDLRWTVCDVPHVNETGRRVAEKRGETQLAFTADAMDGNNADIYLTSGALQCIEEPFAGMLAKLKDKPPNVLINRVPFTEGSSFFTLQHTGYSVVPYQIPNLARFVASIEGQGYRLVEQWVNDRPCEILLRPDLPIPHYYGFYFKRA